MMPRAEMEIQYGTERSIGTGEFWVPLSQGTDRVLYGDLRLMNDDRGDAEGNAGVGYREIIATPFGDDMVAGGHLWIDHRKTDLGSTFNQITSGLELLGRDWDLRANGYIPMNRENSYQTNNIGNSNPYLAGSGILYDTNGTLVEEAQPGFDLELGYRLPIFEEHIDSIRVYGGGYYFSGDKTNDVTGFRTRLAVDISPAISVGGRFQYDEERGSQGFLEGKIRFPFDSKKRFRDEGLRARLDESPERDVDIVSSQKVTDTGLGKPVLAGATGQAQRVLHVDNTAAPGGDGSKDHPFNQLKLAENALLPNDVIYVHAGDGTNAGQNLGIVINKPNVSLIGSGSNFVYDGSKFTTDNGKNFSGAVLAVAGTAPVISNSAGTAISSSADQTYISGLTINQMQRGILINNSVGATWTSASIDRVNVTGSTVSTGITVISQNANSVIKNISVTNSSVSNSKQQNILVYTLNGGHIDGGIVSGNTSNASIGTVGVGFGIHISSVGAGSAISNIRLKDNLAQGNSFGGMYIFSSTNGALSAIVEGNTLTNNSGYGLFVDNDTTGTFDVDLGGGALGSLGRNSLFGNGIVRGAPYNDLTLDLNGSLTPIPAQNNWWGQSGGPIAGQVRGQGAGVPPAASTGTADSSNALSSAP